MPVTCRCRAPRMYASASEVEASRQPGGVAPEVHDLRIPAHRHALELERGRELGVDGDRPGVDPRRGQLGEGEAAEGVVPDAADPADAVAEPGEPDGDVRLGAGEGPAEDLDRLQRAPPPGPRTSP